jgi:hypothetical protein
LQLQTNFLGTVTYPTTGAPEGTTYAHVNITQAPGTNPDSINWMAQLQFPKWTAVKNANYKLSFKAKSSVTTMKVGLNRGAPSYAYVNGFAFTLTTAWQTYSCSFTDTASGNGVLLLNFSVGAAVGTYDFDSVNLVQTGSTTPTNSLISNGGFELDGAGWGLYVQTPNATATMTFPSTGAPEGSKYASVSVTATSDASQVQLQLPLFTAEVNAVYVLTYKARGAGSIEVVSQAGPPDYTPKESSYQDITSNWTTYSQTFTSDVAGSGALRINFWLGLASGTYDFDSVSVVKSTVSIRTADAAAFPNAGKLTARKLANGMAISAIGPLSQDRFSLGVYSPEGRMIKSVSGSRQNAGAIFVPMNMKRGTYLIRFTDDNGTMVKKMCWM